MSNQSLPTFRFVGKAVLRRDDPYYITRWDKAEPISVVASSRQEATNKTFAVLGDPPLHSHHHWVLRWDSFDEVVGESA